MSAGTAGTGPSSAAFVLPEQRRIAQMDHGISANMREAPVRIMAVSGNRRGNPQHPITTPQGAVALTVVLAGASAFGPTLFNLQAAMVFAGMPAVMILWIYWRDGVAALTSRRWDNALAIPVAAIALIAIFSFVSIQSARNAPKPVLVPSVDDIANRVTLLILPRLQQMMNLGI